IFRRLPFLESPGSPGLFHACRAAPSRNRDVGERGCDFSPPMNSRISQPRIPASRRQQPECFSMKLFVYAATALSLMAVGAAADPVGQRQANMKERGSL